MEIIKMCEENENVAQEIEDNPEILFLMYRIRVYKSEIKLYSDNLDFQILEYEKKFLNLILQCENKIRVIKSFRLAKESKMSLKQAMEVCKNT